MSSANGLPCASMHPPALQRSGLLDWLNAPATGRGLYVADERGGWDRVEYPRLAEMVACAATTIRAARRADPGPVCIAVPDGPAFAAAFFGSLAAGHVASPLPQPLFGRATEEYVAHAASILRIADPTLVIVDDGLEDVMAQAVAAAGCSAPVATLEWTDPEPADPGSRDELALLQFTSGSTGEPRAVRVTWESLEANIAMIRHWLRMGPHTSCASWLPLYHDMGLIGCMLSLIVNQSDLYIMRPDQFIRDPSRWIECFGLHGVQIGVAPNFGYAYAAKRLKDDKLDRYDFSNWEIAITAAERIDAAVLARFAERLGPHGFAASSFMPAYGLAEATLAVTGAELGTAPRAVRLDWATTRIGSPVSVEERAPVSKADAFGDGEGWLVACGGPHPGVTLEIVDDDGEPLSDDHVGEIALRGPSVADGYLGSASATTRFEGARLRTGDIGFMDEGELFVIGRLGDCLKVRGRTVFADEVEARLTPLEGVEAGRCVVLAGTHATRDTLLAIFEAKPGDWIDASASVLRSAAGDGVDIKIVAVPHGTIKRTSSGKPRRRMMWSAFFADAMTTLSVHRCTQGEAVEREDAPSTASAAG